MRSPGGLLFGILLIVFTGCSRETNETAPTDNIIEKALQTLNDRNIPEDNEGTLILKRYRYYLSELAMGNAYTDWRRDSNPAIYNPTVFIRMMDQVLVRKIVANAGDGRDAFDGITGFFERAYLSEVDNYLDSYLIYVPLSFDPAKKYPLVVNLHGYGDSAHLNPYSPVHFDFLKTCERRGVIMVAPCGRQKLPANPSMYLGDGERDVLQVLSSVKTHYPIDEKRIYLTGNSMGGFGTYWIASRHPELFAAIAPVCGFWSGILGTPRVDLEKLKELSVYLVHNDLDQSVPVTESRNAFTELKRIGAVVEYHENKINTQDPWDYQIFGAHNAWDYAYQGTALIDWLLNYARP